MPSVKFFSSLFTFSQLSKAGVEIYYFQYHWMYQKVEIEKELFVSHVKNCVLLRKASLKSGIKNCFVVDVAIFDVSSCRGSLSLFVSSFLKKIFICNFDNAAQLQRCTAEMDFHHFTFIYSDRKLTDYFCMTKEEKISSFVTRGHFCSHKVRGHTTLCN